MWTIDLTNGDDRASRLQYEGGKVRIGRDAENDVRLSSWRVSRKHAEVFFSNDKVFVRDLNSTDGTSVNGARVTTHGPLLPSDRIEVGPFEIGIDQSDIGRCAD